MIAPSRFLLIWLLMLCVFGGAARAQTPTPTPKGPLQMALSSPLAFTAKPLALSVKSGRWAPVAVNLSNTGADGVKGEVRLRMISQGGFEVAPNDYYTTVDLPSNSNKVVWLYGRMERPNISGFEISFTGRGFSALKQSVAVAPLDEEQRLVVTIADNDDGLQGALKSLRANGLFRGGKKPQFNANLQPIRSLQAASTDVPDRWIGFDCADIVILGDFVHTSLAPKQLDAITGWVQGGGNLVVVGGNNAARLNSSPLRALWPLQPTTSAPADAAQVRQLATRYVRNPQNGADRLGGAPVVITRGNLDAAAILKDGSRQSPLFAQGERGAGRVLQLAYNPGQPPFVGWSGQGNLWGDIITSMVDVKRIDIGDTEFVSYGSTQNNPNFGNYNPNAEQTPTEPTGQILKGLSQVKQLKMPPVSQIAWFLALYVFFLVPVNYAVLRLMDKRELAWVTIPVIVAAFSIFAYSAALSIRGTAILTRQVDVVQSSLGSGAARADSLLWLFSPKRTTYTLESNVPGAIVTDYANDAGAKQGAFSVAEPGDNASFSAERANVWMWTDRAFSGQAIGDLGKGVTLSGNALSNGTPLDLQGAVWVKDGRVWALGDLKRGASATIKGEGTATSGADLPGAIANAADLPKIFDDSTISNGIPSNAMRLALGNNVGKLNAQPMLVAWSKTSLAPIPVGNARGDNLTLIIVRAANLTGELAAKRATMQPVSFVPFDPAANGDPSGGGYRVYNAILPAQSDLVLQARGLGISGNPDMDNQYGAPRFRQGAVAATPTPLPKGQKQTWVHFEVLDARSGQWQPLKGEMIRDNSPARGWNFRARIDPQMARTPDRLLSVRARLDNAQAQVSSVGIG